MPSERWNRVEELLHAALERRSTDRTSFLDLGSIDRAIVILERAVGEGFLCVPAYANNPVLERVRQHQRWDALIDRAERASSRSARRSRVPAARTLLGLKTS